MQDIRISIVKHIKPMKIPAALLIFCGFVSITACERKLCQNPPPTNRLLLVQPDGSNAVTATNASRVTIRHTKEGKLVSTKNVRVSNPPEYAVESYEMNVISRQLNDTTHFYVSVDDKLFGVVQLKTHVDNSSCDGWTHVSELRFNGRIVPYDNLKPGYTLTP